VCDPADVRDMDTRSSGPSRHRLLLALLLLGSVAVACGGASRQAARLDSDDDAPRTDEEVLDLVALDEADLPEGWTLDLIDGGDQVTNQVTMDMCGAHFESERMRTARRQLGALDPAGERWVGNESVLYRTATAAEGALVELRAAVRSCPKHRLVASDVAAMPPVRYQLDLVEAAPEGITEDHVVIAGHLESADGERVPFAGVWQRRGRAMTAVYGETLDELADLARTASSNLQMLSADEAHE